MYLIVHAVFPTRFCETIFRGVQGHALLYIFNFFLVQFKIKCINLVHLEWKIKSTIQFLHRIKMERHKKVIDDRIFFFFDVLSCIFFCIFVLLANLVKCCNHLSFQL